MNLHLSTHSVADWESVIQEVFDSTLRRTSVKLGGQGRMVAIDEGMSGKRNKHSGRVMRGQWVVGGIDGTTGDTFLVPVAVRNRRTLIAVVRQWIRPGTTVITDNWATYQTLADYDFHHLTVNHSKNCVYPNRGAHTNTIERHWGKACTSIPKYGRRGDHFVEYPVEHMFKMKYPQLERLHSFFTEAAAMYPPKH